MASATAALAFALRPEHSPPSSPIPIHLPVGIFDAKRKTGAIHDR